jgi:RNA polymerase sigma-70 factor (ECF subfamily)
VEDEQEFEWLFAAEYPAVTRTIFFVVHDRARAEEIAQDAFVQLLRHWRKVRRYESPEAWVRRVAIRLAVRDAKRERRLALIRHESPADQPGPEGPVDVDLLNAIRTLPLRQRSVIALFYFEDRPMDEIAGILDCSVATGWVHLHRARKRLGALLSEEVTDHVS